MDRHVIIVGGGLAGLSAGCYALRNGYRATIVEHNSQLGGVCTAWKRGDYTIDGCIHWLTGGPFLRFYEELGILPNVSLRVLDEWATYRDASDGFQVTFKRDLDAFVTDLIRTSKEDVLELEHLRRAAAKFVHVAPPMDAPEVTSLRDDLENFWSMRSAIPTLLHYRKPVALWAKEHLVSPRLRRLFGRMFPETAPALFLLMVLGYLEKGFLSRPIGGTAAFRDALSRSYWELGGEALLSATVEEIVIRDGRARGVRLGDGSMLDGDAVISTSSAPETVLQLLGGRYDATITRDRLEHWKLFTPIVLASFGVASPLKDLPALLIVDRLEPFYVGQQPTESLYIRTCNEDAGLAPPGHSVIQAMVPTDYDWWAKDRADYDAAKRDVGSTVLAQLEKCFPGIRDAVRMIDVATPLTYWNMARSWRGAYEGWMPTTSSFFGHVGKTLDGLGSFYMAGQWVEPGGGIPMAVKSGRQAVQLLCREDERPFIAAAGHAVVGW
ncbi:MAG TPA: NAD(P)/FAD-dependent oxidoreductase [Polyangiaceae bacterium]|nr:NAD(P)/FAD-dependent oxidoreductase [Polyangiaceae bacterium]